MKRILLAAVMVFSLLVSPYYKIEIKAETNMISDLKWNDNGTADPADDTLTFTAPAGYRSLTSDAYRYALFSGENNPRYGIGVYNATMDNAGKVTVKFLYSGTYGHGFDYNYTVQLLDSNKKQIGVSNEITHSFKYTELTEPTNIEIYQNDTIVFDTIFGAERYVLDIYSPEEKTKLDSIESTTSRIPFDSKYNSIGNIFKITAYNDSLSLNEKTGIYVVGAIKDLKWNDNDTAKNPTDDTLTFTTPSAYRDLASKVYSYSLVSYDEKGTLLNTTALTTKNISLNSTTGAASVSLTGLNVSSGFDLHYAVCLKQTENKITTTILTSNTVDISYPVMDLEAPTNLSLTGQRFYWTGVVGATSYTITVYDEKETELKEYTATQPYQYIDEQYLMNGNVISISARNWNAKKASAETFYTVATKANVAKVKSFVQMLYSTTLDRDPDADGMNYWLDQLVSGKQTGSQVVKYFVFGPEFTAKNYCNEHFLTHLYKAIFSRDPDTEGAAYWEGCMAKGMMREQVLNGFLSGDEFAALCKTAGIAVGSLPKLPAKGTIQTWVCPTDQVMDNGIGNFVLRMYTKCLGREAEEEGAAYWITQLYNGKTGGTAVAEQFFLGEEFTAQAYSDSEYLDRLYTTIFNRDADAEGKTYWLEKMKKGTSRKEVLLGFTDGDEWADICKKYGIKK